MFRISDNQYAGIVVIFKEPSEFQPGTANIPGGNQNFFRAAGHIQGFQRQFFDDICQGNSESNGHNVTHLLQKDLLLLYRTIKKL